MTTSCEDTTAPNSVRRSSASKERGAFVNDKPALVWPQLSTSAGGQPHPPRRCLERAECRRRLSAGTGVRSHLNVSFALNPAVVLPPGKAFVPAITSHVQGP